MRDSRREKALEINERKGKGRHHRGGRLPSPGLRGSGEDEKNSCVGASWKQML